MRIFSSMNEWPLLTAFQIKRNTLHGTCSCRPRTRDVTPRCRWQARPDQRPPPTRAMGGLSCAASWRASTAGPGPWPRGRICSTKWNPGACPGSSCLQLHDLGLEPMAKKKTLAATCTRPRTTASTARTGGSCTRWRRRTTCRASSPRPGTGTSTSTTPSPPASTSPTPTARRSVVTRQHLAFGCVT